MVDDTVIELGDVAEYSQLLEDEETYGSSRYDPRFIRTIVPPPLPPLQHVPRTVRLQCGHSIGSEELREALECAAHSYSFQVFCEEPACGRPVEYHHARNQLHLTQEETEKYEKAFGRNYWMTNRYMMECPNCRIVVDYSEYKKSKYVWCSTCRKWLCCRCQKEWVRWWSFWWCGNKPCIAPAARMDSDVYYYQLKYLRDAPVITARGIQNCPTRRACPACGAILDGKTSSRKKAHTCKLCKTKFCFACLSRACSQSTCRLVDVQSIIPRTLNKQCLPSTMSV